jgi:hypothetical protein
MRSGRLGWKRGGRRTRTRRFSKLAEYRKAEQGLTVHGERKIEKEEKEENFRRVERWK